jgi:hypothetical protein
MNVLARFLLVSATVSVLPGLALAECSSGCPSSCCCSCEYSGPAEGGGTITCDVDRECEGNQTASCSCAAGGCTSSCTTHANQGSVDVDQDTAHQLELADSTLNGVCRWFVRLDSTWRCDAGGTGGAKKTTTYQGPSTLRALLETIADDYGRCVEIDEDEKEVHFRPLGECA